MRNVLLLICGAAVLGAADTAERKTDREEIRAHIDSIFQAFIHKDNAALRATHDRDWRGFLEGSGQIIRGVDEYMDYSGTGPGPYGMTGYKMRDFDIAFQGDAAFVTFVADVDANTPSGTSHRVLRIADFYAKRNGHWIQAGSDTALHPESVAQQAQSPQQLSEGAKKSLLQAREAVWRAFFSNDRAALEKLIPAELITIEAGGNEFGNQKAVLESSAQFAKSGGKLIRLEFPKTAIQSFGYTAIVYTTYEYELEVNGQKSTQSGRATEVFVNRNGQWVNPGWHLDSKN